MHLLWVVGVFASIDILYMWYDFRKADLVSVLHLKLSVHLKTHCIGKKKTDKASKDIRVKVQYKIGMCLKELTMINLQQIDTVTESPFAIHVVISGAGS